MDKKKNSEKKETKDNSLKKKIPEKKLVDKKKKTKEKKPTKEKKLAKKEIKKKEVKKEEKEIVVFSLTEVVIIVIISLLLGGVVGAVAALTKGPNNKELEDFYLTYNDIVTNYYKKINKKDLINSAIKGMIDYIGEKDTYSSYMNKEESKDFDTTVNGEYKGIGATIGVIDQEGLKVVSIFKDSPAEKAGLKKNDIILEVNDEKVDDKSLDEVVKMVKKGKKAKFLISRKGKKHIITVKLGKVIIPSVSGKVIEKNNKKIGYIALSSFTKNSYQEFEKELKKQEKKKIEALVIDLRNNNGGHLKQAGDIISLFLTRKQIMYQIKSGKKTVKVKANNNIKRNYKIAVLINESSASASEVLAAAMKESYKADIVGMKSYGKGTVQKEYTLSSGSSVKYTTEEWLTPEGNSINNKGLEPTEVAQLTEEYYNNPTEANDNQLQKALDLLSEKK